MLNVTTRSWSAATEPAEFTQPTHPTQVTELTQLTKPTSAASAPVAPTQSAPLVPDPGQYLSDTVIPDASQTILDLLLELIKGYANDAWFANDANLQDLQKCDEVWWKGDRLVVPNVRHVRSALLWDYHDSPFAGHLGVIKTLHNMQRSSW